MPDKITVAEFNEKLKQTRISEIDRETLPLCTSGWYMGLEGVMIYEEKGWRVRIEGERAKVYIYGVIQVDVDTEIVRRVLEDIATTPGAIRYKLPISTEPVSEKSTTIYNRAVEDHIRATTEFEEVKKEFRRLLNEGYELTICICQLNYTILRPLTHWIETETFLDPVVMWYFSAQEGIYKKLEKCETQVCAENCLDAFHANMEKLNIQLPNIKTPAVVVTSPVVLSVQIQELDGRWITMGENVKKITIKICEEIDVYLKFYSVKHPDWTEGTELIEVINVVGETSYNFDPSNIPHKRITINSVPSGAKILVVKKET
jgi:hypothetical protein